MKKKVLLFLVLISILFFKINVYASSFNSSIVGDNTFSSSITLELKVTDLKDFSSTCDGLCGYVGTLKYDTKKLELVSIKALNGFDLTQGEKIVLYKSTGVKSGNKILTMTFKNKGLSNNEKTTISITNVVASDGDKDISSKDISKTIQYVKKTSTTTTTKKDEENKTSTTTSEKSNNNNLSSLTVSNGELNFSKDILTYDIVVDSDVNEIKIDAVGEDKKASIKGIGTHTLDSGNNVIEIIVTAEDGTIKTYTINVLHKESLDTDNTQKEEDKTTTDSTNSQEGDKATTIDNTNSQEEPKENKNIIFIISIILFLIILVIIIITLIKRKNDTDE